MARNMYSYCVIFYKKYNIQTSCKVLFYTKQVLFLFCNNVNLFVCIFTGEKDMKKEIVLKRLKSNLRVLISFPAVLALFLSPSKMSVLLEIATFFGFCILSAFVDLKEIVTHTEQKCKNAVSILTFLLLAMGARTFYTTWSPSSKAGMVATLLHLPKSVLLVILGTIAALVGRYALYNLLYWCVKIVCDVYSDELSNFQFKKSVTSTFKHFGVLISFCAFLFLNAYLTFAFAPSFAVAIFAWTATSDIWTEWLNEVRSANIKHQVLSALTAIGICWATAEQFYLRFIVSSEAQAISAHLPESVDIVMMISICGALCAVVFVFLAVSILLNRIRLLFSETNVFDGITIIEKTIYVILLIATILFAAFAFSKSVAFYGSENNSDIVYTSDSPDLVKGNVFLWLRHPENDLRQPLFAVFAVPLSGAAFLLGKLMPLTPFSDELILNISQIVVMLTGTFILTQILELSSGKRICFMILNACSYTYLLFSVMMEQYIVAYFWLMLALYVIKTGKNHNDLALIGAGGSLLTSLIITPLTSEHHPIKHTQVWIKDMICKGCKFVLLMLVLGRFDVIYNLTSKINQLNEFTGRNLTLNEKTLQYWNFVSACFFAPKTTSKMISDHISWQLVPAESLNWVGVLLFVVAVVSFAINRNKKSSQIAFGWVLFSIAMLVILGWGTQENGLILYALYFGWAYLALIFQLAETGDHKIKRPVFIPLLVLSGIVSVIAVNLPAMFEMIQFMSIHYPV